MNKEDYVYQVFQRVAPGYDAANRRISLGLHTHWKQSAASQLLRFVPNGGRILDLCCGTGDMTALLLRQRPDLRLTALDFSPAMLAEAEKRLGKDSRVELIRGNAMSLPFSDGAFDGAVISFALRNTADYGQVFSELSRVCRSGAPVCVVDSFVPGFKPVLPFYRFFFSVIMPTLGGGRRLRAEYRWLNRSTEQFLRPEELCTLMDRYGLRFSSQRRFMFGACVSICTRKS